MQYVLLIYDTEGAGEREGLMQEYFAYTDELTKIPAGARS